MSNIYEGYDSSESDDVSILLGKTLNSVVVDGIDKITFTTYNNEVYVMYHESSCCESVTIEDIVGEVEDLIGSPILMAEQIDNTSPAKSEYDNSWTWTFYKFATAKGYVTIRWYGTSNGYYSEAVNFIKLKKENE